MLRFLGWLLVVLGTSGCATRGALNIDCPNFSTYLTRLPPSPLVQDIQSDARELDLLAQEGPSLFADPLGASLAQRAERKAAGEDEAVLLLSGGGQWGAFGTGLLSELQSPQNGLPPRYPDFRTITGVSTGGLQALFIGVGDDEAFRQLKANYRPNAEKEVVERNAQWLTVLTGSMAGLKPLRARIRRALCDGGDPEKGCSNIERLAQSGRDVFIGFVEADSGDFYYADAVKIAKSATPGTSEAAIESRRHAQQCLTGAALASAAMPVFFQQVRVDSKTYYDGGVRQSIFEAAVARRLAAAAAKANLLTQQAGPALYVVRNGPTSAKADTEADFKADAITNALRAEAIIVNELEVGSIAELRLTHPTGPIWLVTADGYNKPFTAPATADGPERRVEGCPKPPHVMFDPAFMRCIMDFGRHKAVRKVPWTALGPIRLDGSEAADAGRTR